MSDQTVIVEVYVREMIYIVTKVLSLTKKEPRRLVHLMRQASKKIQNLYEQTILLLGQM